MTSPICDAIRERKLIEFDYKGHHRVVAPYCHGTSKRGAEAVRAIQLEGESSSSIDAKTGKMWIVAGMQNVRVTNRSFIPDDPNYNPDDSAMSSMHCRV
jgi:hypothetical protein